MARRPQHPPTAPYSSLGERLQKLRDKAGLTQRQLAARAGVSRSTVQALESGRHPPTPAVLKRWLAACHADDQLAIADRLAGEGRTDQRDRRYGLNGV